MPKLTGYAARFDSPSLDLGGFTEIIRRGAFARSLEERDILALYHHGSGDILGRTSNGTLELHEDAAGLPFSLDLPDTQLGRDVRALVKRQDVGGMSFAFMVTDVDGERWSEQRGEIVRELLDVTLFEITATPVPAYPETSVSARSESAGRNSNRKARMQRKLLDRISA